MKRTAVINVVGLTESLIGEHTPKIHEFLQRGAKANVVPAFPAVTCTAQSNYVTGTTPSQHGIVGNGWYNRELAEVQFWKQSNHIVHGRKIWDELRALDPNFTCAKLFWWYNMYARVDFSVTPRPLYLADGKKLPDVYAEPPSLRDELNGKLGQFPLFHFWGPNADIRSSRWIADSALHVYEKYQPSLTLVYLPHLDYNLQRLGPDDPAIRGDLRAIDGLCGELIERFERDGARVVVISEYGITSVTGPIHINRVLRAAGLIRIKPEVGRETLDAGASDAHCRAGDDGDLSGQSCHDLLRRYPHAMLTAAHRPALIVVKTCRRALASQGCMPC